MDSALMIFQVTTNFMISWCLRELAPPKRCHNSRRAKALTNTDMEERSIKEQLLGQGFPLVKPGLPGLATCWLVVSNIFYVPFHTWDVILPIDDLHHFSDG
jgi:hypothetical protein